MTDTPRVLAVLLHADVAGSTALVQREETLAHARITEAFRRLASTIKDYGGTVHEVRGDALVAEFSRASDAVCAALAFQQTNTEHNAQFDDGIAPAMRMGISLGEVVIADQTVTGAGVVLAQRLEQLAEVGGVCIQQAVYEALPRRLPFDYEALGEQRLKGFEEPVRAYSAKLKAGAALPAPSVRARPRRTRHLIAAAAAIGVLVVSAVVAWLTPWTPTSEPLSSLPDRPSIAVLPFDNLSGDQEQDYFSDGMTDDLITDLSKISALFVIARNSSFAYKGQSTDVRDIARELGVRYVLEGSVRRAGNQVRINAQLIDATTGGHLWAERYDRDDKDLFKLQNEVISKIVSALAIKLTDTERAQLARPRTDNLEAYDYYLRAERRIHGWSDRVERNAEVVSFYEKAIALDPKFADAYAGLATIAAHIWRYGSGALPPPIAKKRAYEAASKALSLDPRNSRAYSVLAILQAVDSQHEQAIASAEKAIALNPNNAEAYVWLSRVLIHAGKHAEALVAIETAFRFNPKPPPYLYAELGSALFWNRQYEKAIELLEKARSGGVLYFNTLAMTYAQLGRVDEARTVVDEIRKRVPFVNLNYYRVLSKHYKREEDREHRIASLRKAGIPEWPFGYEGRAEDLLDEHTVRDLVFGRTWVGQRADDVPFIQEITNDGKVAIRTPASLMAGEAWVEEGMLCYDLPTSFTSRSFCGYLFRNPTGTSEQKNEYVQVGVAGVSFFSVQP